MEGHWEVRLDSAPHLQFSPVDHQFYAPTKPQESMFKDVAYFYSSKLAFCSYALPDIMECFRIQANY